MPAVIAITFPSISYVCVIIRSIAKYTKIPVTTQIRNTDKNAPTTSKNKIIKKTIKKITCAIPTKTHSLRRRTTS